MNGRLCLWANIPKYVIKIVVEKSASHKNKKINRQLAFDLLDGDEKSQIFDFAVRVELDLHLV